MALKVFDLQCEHGHVFEGWFGSHDDYDAQQARGLLSCPVCASASITKRLSAPHLNVAHLHQPTPAPTAAPAAMQAEVMRKVREILRKTENVGAGFAAEARRIHEGEAVERPIRGTATADERAELAEDGIDILSVPAFLDEDQLQ
ncbi:DUF1178 family protein [Bordetella holmesii]|uniref:PF06676 family protein n=2 Tax=Bordetella holmesii TaxID=35814 RepID=A0A158M158_9BORD|nr:DUF1178 family protein [Bordetella holmesii]AHV91835.1 hypothetical protein D560_0817 [Bordetella holmesii ATCC 51541]AIT25482.1 hypothetical protein D558_0802 [Bordetella holmesii 44057]EWM43027.1 hypothetical protein D556_0815 [Bordetella holmesii 41130]EWM46051.1 hypothetical protein D555_0824 [Bordetella holmesii 35009]EWM50203.1 hypothetical protein D557_0046 [Bordetella holmesii 70147]